MKVTLKHNIDKKGIEIHFDGALSKQVKALLRAFHFGYSRNQKMWYKGGITNQTIRFAKSLKNVIENELPLSEVEIEPSLEDTVENLEAKRYSIITIKFINDEGEKDDIDWLVFETNGDGAQLLGQKFADSMYEGKVISVQAIPKNYIRKARKIFGANRIIDSAYQDTPTLDGFEVIGETSKEVSVELKSNEKENHVKTKEERKEDDLQLMRENIILPVGIEEPFATKTVFIRDAEKIRANNPELQSITNDNLSSASAINLFKLSQMSHPNDYGLEVKRGDLHDHWLDKGEDLFKQLKYPLDDNYPYINIHSGYSSVKPLIQELYWSSNKEKSWWAVIEHYRPIADIEKAIKDIKSLIAELENLQTQFVNPKTKKPFGKYKEEYRELEWEKERYIESLDVIKNYSEENKNEKQIDMGTTDFKIGKNLEQFLPKQQLEYLMHLDKAGKQELAPVVARLEKEMAAIPKKPGKEISSPKSLDTCPYSIRCA